MSVSIRVLINEMNTICPNSIKERFNVVNFIANLGVLPILVFSFLISDLQSAFANINTIILLFHTIKRSKLSEISYQKYVENHHC